MGPVSCIFSATLLAGDVKEPTHSSRCGALSLHAWVGWVGESNYGLIAAARGAFTS